MGTYGRNFEFRIPPRAERRHGRYAVPTTGDQIPMGAPVGATAAADPTDLDLQPVTLVTSAVAPKAGVHGLVIYEYGPAWSAGDDPLLTTYSDKGTIPLGAAVQVIHGSELKVVFTNTVEDEFLDTRTYPGRVMVPGLGATPTIAVGDLLTPGPGSDSGGYWQETSDAALGWLRVVHIDLDRLEVEAEFVF